MGHQSNQKRVRRWMRRTNFCLRNTDAAALVREVSRDLPVRGLGPRGARQGVTAARIDCGTESAALIYAQIDERNRKARDVASVSRGPRQKAG